MFTIPSHVLVLITLGNKDVYNQYFHIIIGTNNAIV
jgi:hypothetical protein